MNRLVLIGNGFDLAHGLKTKYEHFIDWYWEQRVHGFFGNLTHYSEDPLCTFEIYQTNSITCWNAFAFQCQEFYHNKQYNEIINFISNHPSQYDVMKSPFFAIILQSIETKKWVDIENEYYNLLKKYALEESSVSKVEDLNKQLLFMQEKLVQYLREIAIKDDIVKSVIRKKIYAPFNSDEIPKSALNEHIEMGLKLSDREWDNKLQQYGNICYNRGYVDDYKKRIENNDKYLAEDKPPDELLLPNQIMLLSFNYTNTAQLYCKESPIFTLNQIHGNLNKPESVIFGYGDELDEDYKKLLNKNENSCLSNIKSVKYLEFDNRPSLLDFIESEPYQIIIMGHSCGNSDRTLLNALFEHKNCVSIKPYYYKDKETGKDNFLELVQNITRNFTNMKLMHERVIVKPKTEPLT